MPEETRRLHRPTESFPDSLWEDPWAADVGHFLLGETSEADLMGDPLADTDWSLYYAAVMRILDGDAEGARELLRRRVAEGEHDATFYGLAWHELSLLDPASTGARGEATRLKAHLEPRPRDPVIQGEVDCPTCRLAAR